MCKGLRDKKRSDQSPLETKVLGLMQSHWDESSRVNDPLGTNQAMPDLNHAHIGPTRDGKGWVGYASNLINKPLQGLGVRIFWYHVHIGLRESGTKCPSAPDAPCLKWQLAHQGPMQVNVLQKCQMHSSSIAGKCPAL